MKKPILLLFSGFAATSCLAADPTFSIDAAHPSGKVSPTLYGLMTEEISHSYDGGLYAELIQNRAFLDDASQPAHWTAVQSNGAAATIALDQSNPFNDALTTSLRVTVSDAAKGKPAGVANGGYWGIPVQPDTAVSGRGDCPGRVRVLPGH